MSRRTAERMKAVRKAWEREQQLVSSGEGTRDWTPDQQKSILDIGVALDDEGKPFEGQHMKSVAAYPEYAGDPDNIQFLTRKEHLEAHDGNWQNQTNWYYDPITKEKHIFGEDLIPCKTIPLSDPICSPVINSIVIDEEVDFNEPPYDHSEAKKPAEETLFSGENSSNNKNLTKGTIPKTITEEPLKAKKSFGEALNYAINSVENFSKNHPHIVGFAKGLAKGAVVLGTAYVAGKEAYERGKRQSNSNYDYMDYDDNTTNDYPSLRDDSVLSPNDDISDLSSSCIDSDLLSDESVLLDDINYPDKRSSPREHMVSASIQRYHTKNGVVPIEKKPYLRGGNNKSE